MFGFGAAIATTHGNHDTQQDEALHVVSIREVPSSHVSAEAHTAFRSVSCAGWNNGRLAIRVVLKATVISLGRDMADKLVTTIEHRRSGARLIRFTGVLDEHNRLGELSEKVGAGTALLNLSGIERMNSTGVRDWMMWIEALRAKGSRPVLVACSPVVVDQLNRIKNFAGSAVVKSFHVPYVCPGCEAEKKLLVHVSDMGAPPYTAPACACDACGRDMQLAADPQSYFAFLAEQPRPGPGQRVDTPTPELARGSRSGVVPDQVMRISQIGLRRASQPSLSAFQVPDRQSEREFMRTAVKSPLVYVIMIVGIVMLLVGTLGVLGYFLILS